MSTVYWWEHCPAAALCCRRKWCPKHPINKHIKTCLLYYLFFHQIIPLSSDVSCIIPHRKGQMVFIYLFFFTFSYEIVSTDKLIKHWHHHKGEEFVNTLSDAAIPFHTHFIKSDEPVADFLLDLIIFFSPALIKCRAGRHSKVFSGSAAF